MLGEHLRSLGYSIDVSGPSEVWCMEAPVIGAADLFWRLLSPRSIVHYLLNLQDYPAIGPSGKTGRHEVSLVELTATIESVAESHQHKLVNEVHFFFAILLLCFLPEELEFLAAEYRRRWPAGTPRTQMLMSAARAANQPEALRMMAESTKRTPFAREEVFSRLSQYLSDEYFPFGDAEWSRYSNAPGRTRTLGARSNTLIGFAARQLRDAYLGQSNA